MSGLNDEVRAAVRLDHGAAVGSRRTQHAVDGGNTVAQAAEAATIRIRPADAVVDESTVSPPSRVVPSWTRALAARECLATLASASVAT